MILDIAKKGLLDAAEIARIEENMPTGITSAEVIDIFQTRGVKLSEATFRKYIQLGLLPTSKRVGSKGKYRGSKGVYPVSIVRRINLIKQLMQNGLTLEEIRDSFLSIQNDLELLDTSFERLFGHMDDRLQLLKSKGLEIKGFFEELTSCREKTKLLHRRLEKLGSRLAAAGPLSTNRE